MTKWTTLMVAAALAAAAGCGNERPESRLVFWHTQSDTNAMVLQGIVDVYNATDPSMKVALEYAGDYSAVFRKVRAAIGTKMVPDLVVAYESMIAEYVEAGAVVALDDYINDPAIGLSPESLADIFPGILENNRYPAYGDKYYTFPFTKSVLMMYYNLDLLEEAGFDHPPETWTEFQQQCMAVKEKLDKPGYAISVDASTIDGMVMSFGGKILSEDRTEALFDRPPGVSTFTLIHELVKAGAAYQADRSSYQDRSHFSAQQCAFFIRSSTSGPQVRMLVEDRFNWDLGPIPHGEGQKPLTVLFGANIAVMETTPERQRAAWEFIKYFSSAPVTAVWAMGTGYVPVRKSAAEHPLVKEFFAADPHNRRAFDALPHARPEPGVLGWQTVRDRIERAESEAIGGRKAPEDIAKELAEDATRILRKAQR